MHRTHKYDWAEIQRYYNDGHTYVECRERFGFAARTWHKATLRGDIRTRSSRRGLTVLLKTSKSRYTIKRRLIEAGILKNQCERCGISEWRGKPISIQLDHINGINDDYRLENLRMLCPNCHSLTETYGQRNAGRKRASQRIAAQGLDSSTLELERPTKAALKMRPEATGDS